MTEETKKLFNAPWSDASYVVEDMSYFDINDAHGQCMCSVHTQYFTSEKKPGIGEDAAEKTMNRILRLPELYDALASVMYEGCNNCLTAHRSDIDPTFDFFMDHGCPLDHGDCPLGKHWTTLRKVREGK